MPPSAGCPSGGRRTPQAPDWGLSLPDALDHLIAGRTDSDAECAGNAYHSALQHIIDHNASDTAQLGTYSKPSTFFGLVDDAMRSLGVPADLLPHGYLFGGPPDDFPFVPHSVDGYPCIGHLPLARTKPAADAYRAVLDRLDQDFRYDVQELAEKLEFEHEEWEYATKKIDWYTQDTLFFSLTRQTIVSIKTIAHRSVVRVAPLSAARRRTRAP
ncbi:DUF7691 family protein [Streptomyces flaveolus]